MRLTQHLLLNHIARLELGVALGYVFLHLGPKISNDEDHLFDIFKGSEAVEEMPKHSLASHVHQRLRLGPSEGT